MEVVAVFGGIAAFAQLAGYGLRFARTLEKFAQQAGSVFEEIDRFATQVKIFSMTIDAAYMSLSDHSSDHRDSEVLRYLSKTDIMGGLAKESDMVKRSLVKARDRVLSMQSRHQFVAAIRWSFMKRSILELSPEMVKIQTSISLFLHITHLEILVSALRKGNPQSREEFKRLEDKCRRLKSIIKTEVELRKRLEVQIKEIQAKRGHVLESPLSSGPQQQDALAELGRSMVARETVPNAPHPPGPATEPQAQSLTSSSSYETSAVRSRPSRTSSAPTRPSPRSGDARRRPFKDGVILPPVQGDHSGGGNDTSAFADARPVPKPMNLNLEFDIGVTAGYIRASNGGWTPVTARVDKSADNIITFGKATRLGLFIEPYDDAAEAPVITFTKGRPQRSVGKVTLEWRDSPHGSPNRPSFPVQCEVCESFKSLLVFGEPFMGKRALYWGKGPG